jgi:thioredoxin reductase (NADPH)
MNEPAFDPALIRDPTDPFLRTAQTFPTLTEEMAARMAAYGREEAIPAGTLVYERGQRGVDMMLVREGAIEVFDLDNHGQPRVFVTHRANQFTGELDHLNRRQVLVSARTAVDSRVVRIAPEQFRRMVTGEPDIGELIMRAFILRRVGLIRHRHGGVVLIGSAHAADTLRLQRFLVRNAYPYRLLDADEGAAAGGLIDAFKLPPGECPVVVTPEGRVLRNPSTPALADELGLTEGFDPAHVYDVAVVGAGPAGLAAAVYAASEGLDTLVIEGVAPGGQAGTSSKIENYLGFPTGISGQALAGRAQVQAQKFGARLAISRHASALDCEASPYGLQLEDGTGVRARAIVIATGARYRKLDLPNYARFEGQGIHYAATPMEQQLCAGEEVVVVGGGNSAGQAAVFLAGKAAHVHILVRGTGLAATMSDYLIQRIDSSPRITLHPHCEVSALDGDERLRTVSWTDRRSGQMHTRPVGNMFLMIGAEPNTDWLGGCLELDANGFVLTGQSARRGPLGSAFLTSRPGIFAVGDVRSGSVKRVAAGVGEGSAVVSAVHAYLHPGGA